MRNEYREILNKASESYKNKDFENSANQFLLALKPLETLYDQNKITHDQYIKNLIQVYTNLGHSLYAMKCYFFADAIYEYTLAIINQSQEEGVALNNYDRLTERIKSQREKCDNDSICSVESSQVIDVAIQNFNPPPSLAFFNKKISTYIFNIIGPSQELTEYETLSFWSENDRHDESCNVMCNNIHLAFMNLLSDKPLLALYNLHQQTFCYYKSINETEYKPIKYEIDREIINGHIQLLCGESFFEDIYSKLEMAPLEENINTNPSTP